MTFEELKNVMPQCPNCGRHCPIDDLNCNRGKDMVEKILAGEATPEDYLNRSHEEGIHEGGRHGQHGHEHGEGEHGRGRHEHGEYDHDEMREHPHRGFGPRGEGRRHRPMPPMPEDDSLMSLLFHTAHAVRLRPEHGPGMGQKKVLTVLNEEGSLSQSVLQEKLAVRPGSLSELLGKLEGKGLIQRIPDPEDRRKNLLSLTEEGKAEIEKGNEHGDFEKDAFSMLSEEETETLKALLKKILEGKVS